MVAYFLHLHLEPVCCKKRQKSPRQETGLLKRGRLRVLNDTKWVLNKHKWPPYHIGSIFSYQFGNRNIFLTNRIFKHFCKLILSLRKGFHFKKMLISLILGQRPRYIVTTEYISAVLPQFWWKALLLVPPTVLEIFYQGFDEKPYFWSLLQY